MPTYSLPKPIKINVTGGVKGQPITIINRTTGEAFYNTLGATTKHLVELQNLPSGYTVGDVIDIMVSGEYSGSNTITTTTSEIQDVTISTTNVTTGVDRGI